MTDSMRAVIITEFGGPDVLRIREVERPRPGTGEIRVRVRSSGVNRADLIQRLGHYPAPPGAPEDIPGLEFAGEVETLGPGVTLWEKGDRVMGITGGGGYAEEVVVHERTAVRVPRGVSLEDAGAIPEVFMTAFDAIILQMALAEGETLLVHAVGSGVGTAAVQLARTCGARVLGTSRTRNKVDRALRLGLDVGILAGEGWPERVLSATGQAGVNVILDLVGADYLAGNLEVMATGARQVVVGVPSGPGGVVDLRRLMKKRALIKGTVLRARPLEEKIALAREFERRVCPLFDARKVVPVVDRTVPAAQVSRAQQAMENNENFGKILLLWD